MALVVAIIVVVIIVFLAHSCRPQGDAAICIADYGASLVLVLLDATPHRLQRLGANLKALGSLLGGFINTL